MGGLSLRTPFPAGWPGGHPALSRPLPCLRGPLHAPVGFLPLPPPPRHSVWYQLVPSAPCSKDSQSQSKLVWGLPDQRGGGSPAQSPHLLGLKSRLRMCVRACVCYRRNAKLQPSCLFLSLLPLGEGLLAWCLQAELAVLMGEAGGPSPSIRAVPLRPAFYRSFPRTEPFRVGAGPAPAMVPGPVTHWPCGWALASFTPRATFFLSSWQGCREHP